MKKLLLSFVFVPFFILFVSSTPAYASTVFSDSFTAPDGTSLNTYNSDYSIVFGSVDIQNNKAHSSNGSVSGFIYPHNGNDYEVCTDSINALEGIGIRNDLSGTGYQLVATGDSNTSTPTVYTYVNGNAVNTHNGSDITISGSHSYCLSASGSDITAKYDGNIIISFTDNNINSGSYIFVALHDYTSLGWDNPVADVDNFTINEPSVPANKDQCKKDGWVNFLGFKNQGSCVSFIEKLKSLLHL
jgi:hypothetical protein